jgi:hypothetical protein
MRKERLGFQEACIPAQWELPGMGNGDDTALRRSLSA